MALSRKKKIIIGVSAVVLLAIIIVGSVLATRTDTPEVTVVKLETRKELRSTVTSSGEIRPIQFMNLTSEVQGRIEEIYVKEGDTVTKGQPLVKLDPNQLNSNTDAQIAAYQTAQDEVRVSQTQVTAAQNQYSQAQQGLNASDASVTTARQNVVTSQTDVDRAQVDVNTAQRELNRNAQLLESGVISRQEYDQKKDALETAQVGLRTAKARLESAKLSVNEAIARRNQQAVAVRDAKRGVETASISVQSSQSRANQQAATLRGSKSQRDKTLQVAPINGVIAEIPSKVGTFAVAGLSTTALLTIADMSQINVEVKVDETEIDKVEVGQKAKVKVDAFGDKEIGGEVLQKTPLAVGKSQTSGGLSTNINVQEAKEFRVVIKLTELPEDLKTGLRPGMSATATITTKTVTNVITVPLQAVIEKKPDASPAPTIQGDTPQPADKPKTITGVYVLEGNKAKFVEVTTGIVGESDREITSGLKADDEVITGPSRILNTLKDGTVVKRQTKKEGAAAK
ncbi:MAG TPA: efflux RND transporter periplasmic adaptor subunit [Pyrinomonadaceae bacterium]|nr:efflux RND transporter periplasmic adaptor subunit [Chloracidobacterium sp.]MBP9935975.1 efflux RND transporter periplasmic adaptor subunit [Pyrinomonadaceae bacterium]MBL0239195.1 efflux RND transporter periplasmic adaptor subunit [Chloracidobacterium sp.]HQX56291.1 efflux RND transporter periplasmic adaptor subunit [Pyrinomonadaceae bacterium]HQY67107.1 efflux RND transporter periplasmic adaptor subunit [Pyrinomonadaceae bacterium]